MNNTENQKEAAEMEFKELKLWFINERQKIIERLRHEGAKLGLDGHTEDFAHLHEIFRKRCEEIAEKYDLPVPK